MATDTRDAAPRAGRPARVDSRRSPFSLLRRIRQFVREVIAELRKVVYPGRSELITYVIVVLAFVTVMTAFVSALDFGLTKAVIAVFG